MSPNPPPTHTHNTPKVFIMGPLEQRSLNKNIDVFENMNTFENLYHFVLGSPILNHYSDIFSF